MFKLSLETILNILNPSFQNLTQELQKESARNVEETHTHNRIKFYFPYYCYYYVKSI